MQPLHKQSRTGAIPHPGTLTPPIQRVGGLTWWIFRNSDEELEVLVKRAGRAGFPAIFLPLPHPVAHEVAFQRGLERATATTPGETRTWRADRVLSPSRPLAALPSAELVKTRNKTLARLRKVYKVPQPIEREVVAHFPQLAVAVVQLWEPLWKVYLWCAMRCDDAARHLPLSEVLFTAPVVAGQPALSLATEMQERVRNRVGTVLENATAPEIGEGVIDALEEVGGVKLRPGLFSVPGEAGVRRGEAVLRYLDGLGGGEAGMYDLYEEARGGAKSGLVLSVLRDQMMELETKVNELDVAKVGVGALRTLWFETRAFAERLALNQGLLGEHLSVLKTDLKTVQDMLAKKAAAKTTASGKAVVLEPQARKSERQRLAAALRQVALAARAAKPDLKALKEANGMLIRAQGAVRELRLRLLVRRLRRLVEATCYALETPAGAGAGIARRRMLFASALQEAVAHVEERLAAHHLVDGDAGPVRG